MQISIPVISKTAKFSVNRIYCIGRNYAEHAIEMGHDDREPPFFFQKPADAIAVCTSKSCVIPYPPMTSSLHHEAELVVAIKKGGLRIDQETALDHVFGYAIGCDLTRRDLQSEAKKLSRPWATAKGFDFSAPIGPLVTKEDIPSLLEPNTPIVLKVNEEIRQNSTIDKMVWTIPEMISILSTYFRLKPGDLIFTGTPAGVAAIEKDDQISIYCGELPPCEFTIGKEE